jgi:hypothetical protein
MAFVKFQGIKTEQDPILANAVESQMKQMGDLNMGNRSITNALVFLSCYMGCKKEYKVW